MPFDRGSLTFAMFELPEALPENVMDLFNANKAGTLDSVTGDPQIGWVTGRGLLDTDLGGVGVHAGGCLWLRLRQAVRKIPSSLLNALCRREEQAVLRAEGKEYLSRKQIREIKEDMIEKHLNKMPPTLSGIPVVIDPRSQLLYTGAVSNSQIDLFVEQFYRVAQMEPLQLTPALILEREFKVLPVDFPQLSIDGRSGGEPAIGRDFLMYLWYFGETVGKLQHPEYGEFDLMIEGPLVFAGEDDDRGSAETTVKKGGSPLRSAEAKAAINVGKKLKKAKLTITRLNQIWSGTFDADRFVFSGFKLPEGEEMNDDEIFAERIENLGIFREALIGYFKAFASAMLGSEFEKTEKAVRDWAKSRDAI